MARGAGVCALALATAPTLGASGSKWSPPATVSACAGPGLVGFPASAPMTAVGPGAIACSDSAGMLALAPLVGGDPAPVRTPGIRAWAPLAMTTTGDGRIVLAAASVLTEGRATSRFAKPLALGSPLALGRAYLGDTAVAYVTPTGIALRVQRHFERRFGPPVAISTRPGAITALHVTLDYRSDALVTWQRGGSIWARVLRANGHLWPLQRVGPSAPHPRLQAVVSDDDRAIVTWTSSSVGRTEVWTSISAPRVRFGASGASLLETFADSRALPDGSLRLLRLSTERVLMVFTGKENTRHAVRAAVVGLDGVKPPLTISDPNTDSVLADVATGPRADAVAAWVASDEVGGHRLMAARATLAGGRALVTAPEPVGVIVGTAPYAALAIDPATDVAIAVWRAGRRVVYAQRLP